MLNLIKNLSGGREACRRPVTFSWRQISSWECSRNESPDLTLLSSFGLLGVLPVCDRKPRAVEVIAVVHVGQPPSLVQGDKKRSNWVDQMEDIWCSISNPIPLPLSLFLSLSLSHTHTQTHTPSRQDCLFFTLKISILYLSQLLLTLERFWDYETSASHVLSFVAHSSSLLKSLWILVWSSSMFKSCSCLSEPPGKISILLTFQAGLWDSVNFRWGPGMHTWVCCCWCFWFPRPVVSNLLCTRDRFHERQFFHGRGVEGMVLGWFKPIICIMHFISNLMPLLIWQEVPVCGPEVGDPWVRRQWT